MTPSAKCLVEMKQLSFLAADYAAKGNQAKAKELRARAEQLGNCGLSSDELRAKYVEGVVADARNTISQDSPEYRTAFHHYVRTGEWPEKRDVAVGTQTITFSQLTQGGPLMPIETEQEYTEALANFDPLTNPAVCDVRMTAVPYQLRTQVRPGLDLSSVVAQNVAETNQQQPQAFTYAANRVMRGSIGYRFALAASLEAEEDIPDWLSTFARVAGVAMGRQLGKDAAIGNGTLNTPSGLFPFLGPSVTTVGTGTTQTGGQTAPNITSVDLNNVFFSVDVAYRRNPKCGWLCADAVYKKIRNASDNQGRPLLSMIDGREILLGKPLWVSPSMSNALLSEGAGVLVFGDLSHFHVRLSKPWLQREINQAGVGDISKGEVLYVLRQKMDSVYLDPSNGSSSPIVWSMVHA